MNGEFLVGGTRTMARVAGSFVMTGSKHGEYYMRVEFPDDAGRVPIQLREGGYYFGKRTHTEMVEEMLKAPGLQSTVVSVGEEKPPLLSVGEEKPDGTAVGNRATASVAGLHNVESHAPNGNSSRTAMDSVEEAPRRSQLLAGLPLQVVPGEHVRSAELAVDFFRHIDSRSEKGNEAEITDVDEYTICNGDDSNPVSLYVLPLEFQDRELIPEGVSVGTSEVSLRGKSGGLDVKCAITAWKLTFPEHEPFRVLVKIVPTSGVKRW